MACRQREAFLSGRSPPLSSAGLLAPPIIFVSLRPRRIQPRALLLLPSSYLTFHLLLEDLEQILYFLLRRPSVLSVEIALRHLRNLGGAGGDYDDRRAIALGRHVRAWEFVLDKPSRSIALLRPAVSRVAICDFKRKGCVVMIRHCFEICAGAGCCFLCGDARRGRVLRSTSRRKVPTNEMAEAQFKRLAIGLLSGADTTPCRVGWRPAEALCDRLAHRD